LGFLGEEEGGGLCELLMKGGKEGNIEKGRRGGSRGGIEKVGNTHYCANTQ
jgi:hypothetical protein